MYFDGVAGSGVYSFDLTVPGGITAADISGNGTNHITVGATEAQLRATLAANNGLTVTTPLGTTSEQVLNLRYYTDPNAFTRISTLLRLTPVADVPPTIYTTSEDTAIVLSGVAVADVDAGTAPVTVTLSVGQGTIVLNTGVSGGLTAAQISGSGTGTITVTAPIAAINATLANATGLTYTPNLNYNGNDVLTVNANDLGNSGTGGPLSGSSTANIIITPVNDVPVDGNEIVNVTEDTPITVPAATGLLANVVDPDGLTPTVTGFTVAGVVGTPVIGIAFTIPSKGDITIFGDGSYTFTPAPDYFGAVPQITYTVSDGAGGTDTSTLDLTVTAVNDAPIVDLNSAATAADTARDYAANFIEATYFSSGSGPVNVADLMLADTNDSGENDITKLTIVAGSNPDGTAEHIMIAGQTFNLATTAGPLAGTVGGTNVFISYNATTKTFTVINAGGGSVPMAQADLDTLIRGVTYNNTSDIPTAGNRTLTFTLTDASNLPSVGAVATVLVSPRDDSNVISLNGAVTLPVLPDANNTTTYVENAAPVSINTATAFVNDFGEFDTVNLAMPLTGFLDGAAEQLKIGSATLTYGTAASQNFTIGGTTFNVSYSGGNLIVISEAGGGTLAAADMNTLLRGITYENTSNNPTAGQRSVGYFVNSAGNSTSDYAYSYINVTAVNDAPVDGNETPTTLEDTPLVVTAAAGLLSNTVDPDGLTPTITGFTVAGVAGTPVIGTAFTIPGKGDITINGDGSYTFTPALNYNGVVPQITYTVSDGAGGVDSSNLDITVTAVNDAPVVVDPANPGTPLNPIPAADPNNIIPDVTTTDGATPASINTAQFFVDPEGDPLIFTATSLPPGLSIAPNGTISGVVSPSASQGSSPGQPVGTYLVTITADDGAGHPVTTTVTYTVGNISPVAVNDVAVIGENAPLTVMGNVITGTGADNDTAPDADPLHVSAVNGSVSNLGQPVRGSTGGTFVVQRDGTWSFAPGADFQALNAGQTRNTTITYLVSDGQGGFSEATVTVTVNGSNDAPVSLGPVPPQTGADGSPITPINMGATFNNPTALPLTYTATGLHSGLSIDPTTGIITGTLAPDASINGPYVVNVTANAPDGSGATIPVKINVTNPAPTAANDAAQTPLNTPVVIAVLANDTDPDHDQLSIASTTAPAHGTVTANADGTVTYTPTPGYTGTDSFTYTMTDNQGGTSTATVNVNVGAPDAVTPTATPLVQQTGVDGSPITPFTVAPSFSDPNSDPLTYTAIGLPPGLSLNPATGQVTGTLPPDASAQGPYTVLVTAIDPAGNQVTLPMVIVVTNPAPLAADDQAVTPADTPVTLNVLGNDTDPDHDPLAVTAVTQPAHGVVVINPDGTVTYTPAAGYTGPDTFTYSVSDGQGGVDIATVTLNVGGTNPNAPTANPMPTQAAVDGTSITPINVSTLAGVSDPNGDTLVYSAVGLPPGLSIDPVTGVVSGILPPDASAHGPYFVQVYGTDPTGAQVGIPFLLNITNPTPVAANDHVSAPKDQPVNISVLANDTDADHDPVTVTSTTAPAHGTVLINPDGTIKYTPTAGYLGPDTFTYTITDAQGLTSTAIVTVDVGPATTLAAPPAIGQILATDSTTITPVPVAAIFGDPDTTATLSIVVDTAALPPGILFNTTSNQFEGTPSNIASQGNTPGQPLGVYFVPVTATDENGASTTQYITFNFNNLPPVAVDDFATVIEDTVTTGNVLTDGVADHDTAPDNDPLTVTQFTIVGVPGVFAAGTTATIPNVGTLKIGVTGAYTFTPAPNYDGAVPVATYSISDGNGGNDQGALTLTIAPVNDAPVVVDPANPGTSLNPIPAADPNNIIPDVTATDGGSPAPINAALYFVDPEGNPLTFTAAGLPPGLMIAPNGTISGVIDPAASQGSSPGQSLGTYVVTITADDGNGHPVTTTVTYTIANLPPVAVNDHAIGGTEDAPQSGNVLSDPLTGDHDTGPDSDHLTVTAITGGTVGAPIALTYGTLKLNPNGSWTFTPNALANTLPIQALIQETVTYTVSDGNGGSAIATLTIDVNGLNDAPTSTPLPPTAGIEGSPLTIPTAQVFHDVDNSDVLIFTATGLPPGLTINTTTGVISGMPAVGSGGSGPYTVTITASDGHGGTITSTFILDVKIPNGVENPVSPVAFAARAPIQALLPAINPILIPAIAGLDGLGSTPSLGNHAVTDALEGIASLESGPDFNGDGDTIHKLVEWAGRQGKSASWLYDLLDGMDQDPHVGDSLALALTLDDANLFAVNSLVREGALFVGIDTIGENAKVLSITGRNAGAMPDYVDVVNNRSLIVNITPDVDIIDLTITGLLPSGRKAVWQVRVVAHTGEILAAQRSGNSDQQTSRENIRDIATQAKLHIHNGAALGAMTG